jgi:hypothetical protein
MMCALTFSAILTWVTRGLRGKIAKNIAQKNYCQTELITFSVKQSSPKSWSNSVIFPKNTKVNTRPRD